MRFIIECDDPADIILGMRSIRYTMKDGDSECIHAYEDGSVWLVRKTKTGYSARTSTTEQEGV